MSQPGRRLPANTRLLDLCARCLHAAIAHENNYGPCPCLRVWQCRCPAFVAPVYLLEAAP